MERAIVIHVVIVSRGICNIFDVLLSLIGVKQFDNFILESISALTV